MKRSKSKSSDKRLSVTKANADLFAPAYEQKAIRKARRRIKKRATLLERRTPPIAPGIKDQLMAWVAGGEIDFEIAGQIPAFHFHKSFSIADRWGALSRIKKNEKLPFSPYEVATLAIKLMETRIWRKGSDSFLASGVALPPGVDGIVENPMDMSIMFLKNAELALKKQGRELTESEKEIFLQDMCGGYCPRLELAKAAKILFPDFDSFSLGGNRIRSKADALNKMMTIAATLTEDNPSPIRPSFGRLGATYELVDSRYVIRLLKFIHENKNLFN